MKKIRIKIAILACLVFLLTSCSKVRFELDICARYSVPGMLWFDLKGSGFTEILEEDSYGRVLYEYSLSNFIINSLNTTENQTVVVILQKQDINYIYFYEDINYLVEGYTEKDLELLKQENDWGKPLDESKMSRRDFKYHKYSGEMDFESDDLIGVRATESILDELSLEIERVNLFKLVDVGPTGQLIYVLAFEKNGETTKYFALVDLSYNVSVMEIELVDGFIDKEAYANFKKDNGWVYGWGETGDGGLSRKTGDGGLS